MRINEKLTIPIEAVLGDVVPVPAQLGARGDLSVAAAVPPEEVVRNLWREKDGRICKSLGIGRETGIKLMADLWGVPFTARRDALAGPDANAQRRGIVARGLKAELRKAIDGND